MLIANFAELCVEFRTTMERYNLNLSVSHYIGKKTPVSLLFQGLHSSTAGIMVKYSHDILFTT